MYQKNECTNQSEILLNFYIFKETAFRIFIFRLKIWNTDCSEGAVNYQHDKGTALLLTLLSFIICFSLKLRNYIFTKRKSEQFRLEKNCYVFQFENRGEKIFHRKSRKGEGLPIISITVKLVRPNVALFTQHIQNIKKAPV